MKITMTVSSTLSTSSHWLFTPCTYSPAGQRGKLNNVDKLNESREHLQSHQSSALYPMVGSGARDSRTVGGTCASELAQDDGFKNYMMNPSCSPPPRRGYPYPNPRGLSSLYKLYILKHAAPPTRLLRLPVVAVLRLTVPPEPLHALLERREQLRGSG